MIYSMTGFAARKGGHKTFSWAWELRSVNAKGLDLRLRVPDWIDGLEAGLRAKFSSVLSRGSVNLSLRLSREESSGGLQVNNAALNSVLEALSEVETRADLAGVSLAPTNAADILSLRGVLETATDDTVDTVPLRSALLEDFEGVLSAFLEMLAEEGRALDAILRGQLDRIADLTTEAASVAEARREAAATSFRAALSRVVDSGVDADPQRVAQELAMLAVKADVTEELDRLAAHVTAARALLDADGPIGRKLDFLMQEFNREANTLCSKSQSSTLTSVGLELKAVIDQMREQVQNVE